MEVKKALQIVLQRWQITAYRLSKTSGVPRPMLSNILKGEAKAFAWTTIEKLANGLEIIDPIASDVFMCALRRPNDCVPDPPDEILICNQSDLIEAIKDNLDLMEKGEGDPEEIKRDLAQLNHQLKAITTPLNPADLGRPRRGKK